MSCLLQESVLLLLGAFTVYCILPSVILSQLTAGLWPPCNFHEPCLLLPMACRAWDPCSFWLSELQRRWPRDQNLRQSTDGLECCKFSLLCSFWFMKGSGDEVISSKWCCTTLGRGRGRGEGEWKNATAIASFECGFSWLRVHLAAIDLWLISRAPIELF